MKRRSFLYKVIAAYGVIAMLYTLVATGVFVYKTYEFSNYQFENNQKEFLLQIRDGIDTKLAIALNIVQQMKSNPKIEQFNKEKVRDQYNVTKIHEELRMIVNSFSDYGLILGMQKASNDYIISSQYTITASEYYKELKWLDVNYQEMERYMRNESENPVLVMHTPIEGASSPYVTLVKRESIVGGEDMFFYMSFFEKMISPPVDVDKQEVFALVDSGGIVSLTPTAALADRQFLLDFTSGANKAQLEYDSTIINNKAIQRIGSQVLPDIQYIHIAQNPSLQGMLHNLMMDSIFIFLLLIGSGAVIISVIAASTYKPYSKIVQANEALLAIANKSKLSMKQKYVRDVLFGYLSPEQMELFKETNQLGQFKRPITIVILEPANYREWTERYSGEGIREMISQWRILIEENMKEIEFTLLEIHSVRFTLVVFGVNAEEMENRVYRMKETVQSGLGLDLIAAVGKSVPELADLQISFQETLDLLDFRGAYKGNAVITLENLGRLAEANYYYPLDVERELITCTIHGKIEQTMALVKQISQENLYKRSLTNETISQFLFALAATANRILQQMQRKSDDVFEEGFNIYTELLTYETLEDLQLKIEGLFQRIVQRQEEREQRGVRMAADQLLDFIHENYVTDLSLTDVANHFKLSEGYVGKWFKERTGENFKDYLNMYRVRIAKQLLDEKYMKIDDLAKMVGCNNAITFTRMFKKYEGISPSQYGKRSE
jgi:two-component system response regulator YesN